MLDTVVAAETPEGILLELRPAGLSARFYAFLLDWLIRLMIAYAAAIATVFIGDFGMAFWLVLYFLLEWFYPVAFELSRSGATPGKSVVGIKVVMDNGLPVTPAASFTRNLLRVADFLPFSVRRRHRFACCYARTASAWATSRPQRSSCTSRSARRKLKLDDVAPVTPVLPLAPRDQAAIVALGRARADADGGTARRARGAWRRRSPATAAEQGRTSRGACSASRSGRWASAHDAAQVRSAVSSRVAGARRAARRRARAQEQVRAATAPVRGERIAALYRRACEHLALARARSYPAYLLDRLDRLTADAHQVIYQQREFGAAALWRLVARDFPRAVRADAGYVWIATALLAVPSFVLGVLVYFEPALILSVVDAATAAQFEQMYSSAAESIGRTRDAGDDWIMFGFYISNNVGVAFQCFASGLAAGLGQHVFPRLQRRVVRRSRGLSARARSWRHVLSRSSPRTARSS